MITERDVIELFNRGTQGIRHLKQQGWEKQIIAIAREMGIIEPATAKERYFQRKMQIATDITRPIQYVYTAEVNNLCDLADAAIKEAEEQNADKIEKACRDYAEEIRNSDEDWSGAQGAR